jgi:acetyltransferase-like isoleucine patch superfamily enzyme
MPAAPSTTRSARGTWAALRGPVGPDRAVGPGGRYARRLSLRNAVALLRWMRLRSRNLDAPLFYADRGTRFDIGETATVRFGRGLRFMRDFEGRFFGRVTLGDGVYFSNGCVVSVHCELTVGENCGFSEWVSIHDNDHVGGADGRPFVSTGFVEAPIVIGDNVWVGAKATILKGVRIGDNAIIGANSVVTQDVPADCVAAGVPARVLRRLE